MDDWDGQLDVFDEPLNRHDALKLTAGLGVGAVLGLSGLGAAFGAVAPKKPVFPSRTSPAWLKVIAAAKKEGSVTYYGVNPDMTDFLTYNFKSDYPWATLNIFTSTPAAIQAKLLTEYATGTKLCDVVQSRDLITPSYKKANAIKPVLVPNDARLPAGLEDRTGYLHRMYISANNLIYNTNIMKTPPPFDLYQLADPKYKGLLGIDNPANKGPGWFVLASRRALWGTAKWNKWMEGLKANNMRTFPTAGDAYLAVVRGEVAIATDSYNDIASQRPGTPVAASWYDGLVALYLGTSLVANAPHPNAAKVFINWMLSPKGQRQFSHSKRFPTIPPAGSLSIEKIVPKRVTYLPQSKMLPYYANADAFTQIICRYLQC
jgi:iron(III) transport system substrate-binding protein